jgi:hypothetical protein
MLLRKQESRKNCLVPLAVALVCCFLLPVGGGWASSNKETKDPAPVNDQGTKDLSTNKAQGPMYKGLLVRQTAINQGSLTIYLCPHKWVLKSGFITIIVDEDKDKIIAYTRQTNKYLLDSIKVGMKRFMGFRKGGDFEWGKFTTVGHEKWHDETVAVLERKGRRRDLHTRTDVVITERQLCCTRIKTSPVFEDIAFALFDVEYKYGLPVRVSRMAHSANPRYCTIHPVIALDTSVIKESTFPASEFEAPKGLIRVKSEVDMFSNDIPASPFEGPKDMMLRREKTLNIPTTH